jgi:hypothetical protein
MFVDIFRSAEFKLWQALLSYKSILKYVLIRQLIVSGKWAIVIESWDRILKKHKINY